MPHPLEEIIHIAPAIWPGRALAPQPGDLTQFAPMGMGLGGPFPIRPWDDPFGPSPSRFYGYQPSSMHPFLGAPTSEPTGGIVYFDDQPPPDDFETLLRFLRIQNLRNDYAVFMGHSSKPEEERYLTQIRLVAQDALTGMFGVELTNEMKDWVQQPFTIGELLWRFIELEQVRWGHGMSSELRGLFGGDGDWAKESLCFGFMVENNDRGVYRLWSRAWLVTK